MMSLPGDLHEHHWEAGCGDTSDHSHSKSNAEGDLPHFAHLQQTTKVSKKIDYLKNLPFGYPPLQVSVVFFSEVEMEFFWRLPTSQQLQCQELRAAVLKAEQLQLQPNEYPAGDLNRHRFCRVDGSWRQFQNLSFGFSIWVRMVWVLESMAL